MIKAVLLSAMLSTVSLGAVQAAHATQVTPLATEKLVAPIVLADLEIPAFSGRQFEMEIPAFGQRFFFIQSNDPDGMDGHLTIQEPNWAPGYTMKYRADRMQRTQRASWYLSGISSKDRKIRITLQADAKPIKANLELLAAVPPGAAWTTLENGEPLSLKYAVDSRVYMTITPEIGDLVTLRTWDGGNISLTAYDTRAEEFAVPNGCSGTLSPARPCTFIAESDMYTIGLFGAPNSTQFMADW